MSNEISIATLREMVRGELQTGWSHLEDGREDFALHHFNGAVEKVNQIKQIKGGGGATGLSTQEPQPPIIDINEQQT
jgi:hypothetical protein